MTREEARGNLIHAIRWNDIPKKEALEIAIKVLDQETCEDAVSKQDVLDAISRIGLLKSDTKEVQAVAECLRAVEALPSVNPQSKIGHWEKMVEVHDLQQNRMLVPYGYDDAKFGNTPVYVCDCGCKSNINSRFCPDCGSYNGGDVNG